MSDARVCVHAHFYQPPRENPWLEEVEPEPSASPHHDWNERITAECYEPNGAARVLDAEGRIESIRNNYASISFNFGPTLLEWMEVNAPAAYAALIEADALSAERFGGHGSALAQPYNHMIMPLASARDRRTQVGWGIADFERRFGRKPEGAWLPETAVDLDTLEALAERGILFTVLAPHQAARVREPGADWREVGGGDIDTTVAYRQALPSGREIAVFFYDGPTSRAVAFEKLLDDGDALADRLIDLARQSGSAPQRLIHIATDGETYGHHHAHGDMALAVALDRLEAEPGVRLANYGSFLAECPPERDVEIRENTSWSCAHGIERWRSDCGCSTGGEEHWDQAWRAPLRDALDSLSDDLARVFEERASRVLTDPWAARDAYGEVVQGSVAERQRYLDAWCPGRGSEERALVLRLLEMQRSAMLMFTSCGWFFNDLAGIETRQILRYAARALDLAESVGEVGLRGPFEARLAEAAANGSGAPDGRQLLEEEVQAARVSALDIMADHMARLASGAAPADHSAWLAHGRWVTVAAPEARSAAGAATVTDVRTAETCAMRCTGLHRDTGDLRLRIQVTDRPSTDPATFFEQADLRPDTLEAIERAHHASAGADPRLEDRVSAIRREISRLAQLAPGEQREESLRGLEGLLRQVDGYVALPLWELQNAWWRASARHASAPSELEGLVARRLGFAG